MLSAVHTVSPGNPEAHWFSGTVRPQCLEMGTESEVPAAPPAQDPELLEGSVGTTSADSGLLLVSKG